ncbi:MAG: D-alanine--D-alanine ligase [Candidatus Omnitrophica bacterium CG11_big_fil_rev_8_21_14_0_20_64_10]|nr:MAG: D-alanine--D-alanine ligase [Candidatus Omnitrophica bacterium CG11_big_fil_rev_8_21_14_0_20_64_10]
MNQPFARGEMVGVLCGGPSAEREISLRSGQAVFEALRAAGRPVKLVPLSERAGEAKGLIQAAGIGVAFIALHGPFGEDGTVQALLETLGIPYTGSSVEASRYAMDKIFSRRRWAAAHLPIPQWRLAEGINAESRAQGMRFPLVIKPVGQGSSFGISFVDTPQQFAEGIRRAAEYGDRVILEEFLSGVELTVGILEGRALPVIQVVPKRRYYDTVAKYEPGMCSYLVPAPLSDAAARTAQTLALAAHEALGCGAFSRVDMIWTAERGPVLLEINTIPGMTASSLLPKAAAEAGIDFQTLCLKMLDSATARLSAAGSAGGGGDLNG